jgi:hypothetical protein
VADLRATLAGALLALSVETSSTIIARSADGASTLAEVRARGPEGGGSLAYRISGKAKGDRLELVVSSDFGDGGGGRPQRVSSGVCAERLARLAGELDKRGFPGVATHPERCSAKSRSNLVTVAKAPSEQ